MVAHDQVQLTGLELTECLAKCQNWIAEFTCKSVVWYGNKNCFLNDANQETYGAGLEEKPSAIYAEYSCDIGMFLFIDLAAHVA